MGSAPSLPVEPQSIWMYPTVVVPLGFVQLSHRLAAQEPVSLPSVNRVSPSRPFSHMGNGPVPDLRFGSLGSACLHIGVTSAVPSRDGEAPSDQLQLWAP